MRLFRAAIALLVLLAATPADADPRKNAPSKRQLKSETPLIEKIESWIIDLETVVRVNSDPVLRAIVCRVPFSNYSLDALTMGTKIPKDQFERAIDKLKRRGLIATSRNRGITMIFPASEDAREAMRRFAMDWCTPDGECGVER